MIAYISTFFFLALFSFFQYIKQLKRYKLLLFIIAVIYLILFAGLRKVGVGADDGNYIETFMNIHEFLDPINGIFTYSLIELNMEYGYVLLNSILRYFTETYTILFLIIALIAVSINALNFYKYSHYIFLVLLLYFVHTYLYRDLNQIRAGITAAILLFTIDSIHNNRILKTLFITFLASLFHLTAIVTILPLLLRNKLNTRKRILMLLLISIGIGALGIGHLILNSLPNLGLLSIKLNNYLEYSQYNYNLGLLDVTNIKNILLLLLFLSLWERMIDRVPYFNTLILFYALAVSLRIMLSDFAIVAARLSSMLGIVEVILIPSLLVCFKNKILVTVFIIFYALFIFTLNLINAPFGSAIYELSIF